MARPERIQLPYGGDRLQLEIPGEWLATVTLPAPAPPPGDPEMLVAAALDQPIGSESLERLVAPGQRVAVLVDDHTRRTPASILLPPLLSRLHRAGVTRSDICIVIALGSHRPMTEEELVTKLGAKIVRQYRVINRPASMDGATCYLGTSAQGIPTWVQPAVAEADLRIGVGMITPHLDAGFSGGAKIILPGVCAPRTVDAFHTTSAFVTENQLGRVEAPLRQRLERFVREQLPLDIIVNVVLTVDGQISACVAGDAVAAHRVGVAHARTLLGVPVAGRYPVVVANCYPYDLDLWQSIKGIWAGDLLVEDGGTLIAVTAATEGNGNYPRLPAYAGRDPDELKVAIERGAIEDGMQAATGVMFGTLMRRVRLVLVSGGLSGADAAAMGAGYAGTVEAAVADAVGRLPEGRRRNAVAVMPQAGIVLPLLPGGTR